MLTATQSPGPAQSLEHLAFEQAGIGMAYLLRDRFVRVNRAFSQLVGRPIDKIEGASFLDITHPDQRQEKRAEFAVLLAMDRRQVTTEDRYIRTDGSEGWFSITASRIETAEADFLIVAKDITARILAERQVREERDKLHAALSSMTDAIFICDRDGNFVNFNPTFAALLASFSGKTDVFPSLDQYCQAFDLLTHDGQALAPHEWPVWRALRGEAGSDEQFIVRRKDNGAKWFVSYHFAPLRTAEGQISGGVVVARDVTERMLAKRQLQAERDKLKAALFSMSDAVFIGDGNDDAPDFNDAFVSFMRFPDREHTLRTSAEYPAVLELYTLSGERLELDQWPLGRAMSGEVGIGKEYKFVRTDTGEWWFASCNFAPIRTPDGTIAGSVAVLRDITQAKLAEDALLAHREELERSVEERTQRLAEAKLEADRANAAKTRFLAAASHDLRQPLQAAKAYLGALERLPPGSNTSEIVTGLETALAVMSGLLGTMLDMSRLKSGFVEPQPTVFPLALLLEQIAQANLPAARSKGLEMRTAFEPCMVSTDRALLLSAVHNLLTNAVRYTEQGFVAVQCRVADNVVTIEVEDSGIGISEEDRSAIFLEYVQLGNPARNPANGVGLGLSLVNSTLDLLGISLRMDSRVGQGTRFAFDLPCVVPPEARNDARPVAQGADVAPAAILLVEDDKAVRESFVLLLQICGYAVHSVGTGAEALAYAAGGNAFDVMITDYRLPDTYGTDVIRETRKIRGMAFPAILITGETQLDEISAQGIVNCQIMSKPVKVPVMMDVLAQLTRPFAPAHSHP